ncbi:MAG: hypothetical protein AAB019_03120 [Planctomycetota bacterium]
MLKIIERFITDRNGVKKAVVLTVLEYRKLLQLIEDMEDAIDLARAAKIDRQFRPYDEIRKELIGTRKINV